MYSYSNLIEIGIVFELLRLGLPFSMIAAIMGSDAVMGLRDTKDFDVVLWTYRQAPDTTTNPHPSHNDPQKKAAPSSIRVPLPTVTALVPRWARHSALGLRISWPTAGDSCWEGPRAT